MFSICKKAADFAPRPPILPSGFCEFLFFLLSLRLVFVPVLLLVLVLILIFVLVLLLVFVLILVLLFVFVSVLIVIHHCFSCKLTLYYEGTVILCRVKKRIIHTPCKLFVHSFHGEKYLCGLSSTEHFVR